MNILQLGLNIAESSLCPRLTCASWSCRCASKNSSCIHQVPDAHSSILSIHIVMFYSFIIKYSSNKGQTHTHTQCDVQWNAFNDHLMTLKQNLYKPEFTFIQVDKGKNSIKYIKDKLSLVCLVLWGLSYIPKLSDRAHQNARVCDITYLNL